jgi:hypothetical protein
VFNHSNNAGVMDSLWWKLWRILPVLPCCCGIATVIVDLVNHLAGVKTAKKDWILEQFKRGQTRRIDRTAIWLFPE